MNKFRKEKIDKLVDILSGFAFDSKKFGDSGEIPLIRIRDILRGSSSTFYSGEYESKFIIQNGDVLIGMDGEFNRERWKGGNALLNQRVCKITVSSNQLNDEYLYHFLPIALKSIEDATPFVTVKHLSVNSIRNIEIPLPPIAEQKRIAEILDRTQSLISKRKEAIAKLDTLTQSIFIEMFGNPIENQKGWLTDRLSKVASVERGKFTPRPRNDPSYYGGKFPFIQTGDISSSCGCLNRWTQTLNEKGIAVSRSFPPKTVVMAIVGATLGITSILAIEVYCPDSVVGIQTYSNKAVPEYIERVLRFWRPIFVAQAPATARANINLETLRPLEIPIPPLPLQKEFAQRVEAVEKLKATHRASLSQLEALFASLQHRAFRGEL
jgi:type I restriction enzyme S subunit